MMNGNNATRERLARKQMGKTLAQAQDSCGGDECHNLDVPPCLLLKQAALDVLPENRLQQTSILGKLSRRHFANQLVADNNNTASTSTTTKKKKKRKKKKKSSAASGEVEESKTSAGEQATLQQQQQDAAVEKSSSKESEVESVPQPPPPPTDESSPSKLREWFNDTRHDDQEDASLYKNRNLPSFLQYLSTKLSHDVVRIDANHIQQAIDAISCSACKQVAFSYFWNVCKSSLLLAPSYMEQHSQNSSLQVPGAMEDVEHAFDYVAMEQGELSTSNNDGDSILTMVYTDPYFESNQGVSLRVEEMEVLLRDVILSHGLSPSRTIDDFMDERAHDLIQTISQQEVDLKNEFQEMTQRQATAMAQLENSVTFTGGGFDVKTTNFYHETDDQTDKDLEYLIQVVRKMSSMHYLTSSRNQVELNERIRDAHSFLSLTIKAMLDQHCAHYLRLLQIATRPGAIPQMYVNARHRDSYRSLLMTKLLHTQELRREVAAILFSPSHIFRKLTGQKLMDEMSFSNCPTIPEQDDYDEFWKATQQITHTIRSGNVQQFQDLMLTRTKEWLQAITAHSHVVTMSSSSYNKDEYDHLLQECTRLQEIVSNASNDDAREGAIPQLAIAVSKVFHLVNTKILDYRLREEKPNYEEGTVGVPPKLAAFCTGQVVHASGECHGGGGRRRVTGILAGLLYQWLSKKCDEWHAELTQNELLESMMDEEQPVDDVKPAKSKKSKKKRDREKKAAAAAAASLSVDAHAKSSEMTNDADNDKAADDGMNDSSDNVGKKVVASSEKGTRKVSASGSPDANGKGAEKLVVVEPTNNTASASHTATKSNDKSNAADDADTWSEWRADLNETGLLDTPSQDYSSTPEAADEGFTEVTKSKRHRRKAAENGGEKKAIENGGVKKTEVPSATEKASPEKRALSAPATGGGGKEVDVSKGKDERDRGTTIPTSGKATKVGKIESPSKDFDTLRAEATSDMSKENNSRASSASTLSNVKATQKKEEEKRVLPKAIPANILSANSKSYAAKAASKSVAPWSVEPAAKEEGLKAEAAEPRRPQKTPDRGKKEEKRSVQPDSARTPSSSPQKRPAVPSAPAVEVGVTTATGFQSAEGFLVERLLAVLKTEGSTKSP